jgi:hypothetical protein
MTNDDHAGLRAARLVVKRIAVFAFPDWFDDYCEQPTVWKACILKSGSEHMPFRSFQLPVRVCAWSTQCPMRLAKND